MIEGFEKYTCSLNDYEMTTLLPSVIDILSRHKGNNNAVSNRDICLFMKGLGFVIEASRVRKIVNYIRRENLVKHLAASSKGYFVCDDQTRYMVYLRSLMERRNAISEVLRCMLDSEELTEEDLYA